MMRPRPTPSVALVMLGLLLVAPPAPARDASTSGPAKARKKEGSTLTLRFAHLKPKEPPPRVFFAGHEVKLPRPLPKDTDVPVRVPASGWVPMRLEWGRGAKHIFLALGEPFTLVLAREYGPAVKPPVPGLKCMSLKPPPTGLRWLTEVGPLPHGRAFPAMDCQGAAFYQDVCVLQAGEEFGSPEGKSLMFVPSLPGLYTFEVREGRIIGRFDPSFGGRASPPATCDEL